MWRSIYCYLSGQHDYQVTCEPGVILLRCRGCGQRSNGWALREALAERAAARPVLVRTERRPPVVERHAA